MKRELLKCDDGRTIIEYTPETPEDVEFLKIGIKAGRIGTPDESAAILRGEAPSEPLTPEDETR
jgi:hypothetical protein